MNRESILKRIAVVEDDITKQNVDGIVNAANTALLGGGGVDGAIHRAAGRSYWRNVASSRLSHWAGQNHACLPVPSKWVIHAVGPIWRDGNHREDELLASCYRNCFALAAGAHQRLAFPAISTGACGFTRPRDGNCSRKPWISKAE